MAIQKIAVFDALGETMDFHLVTAAIPEPGPHEVRFKVSAFALNQADILLTQGRHYVQADLPIRLGYEGCGVIDAIGAAVTRFTVGDRVTCIPNVDGPYWTAGEYALAREDFVTAWPEGYSAAEASSLWMQYLTPYFPFAELFPFRPDDWVMITAATGGTGLGSVSLAKLLGARLIATTRTESKAAVLKARGADEVISTDDPEFVSKVNRVTEGQGVRLINDTLCGPYVPMLTETLSARGVIFIHGALAGDNQLSLPVLNLVHRGAGLYGYSLINELRRPGALDRARDFILAALADNRLPRPLVDRVFPFDQVRAAYDRLRQGLQSGKIVVSVDAMESH
jgi:NADPH:quinone reductase-like Zn-dependent oxidoreductase